LKNKLTVIVPLKDRPEYTPLWIENNYNEDYEYIIADGSHSDKNEKIFQNLKKKNIQYLRFKPDYSYKDYYNKMYECSLLIKTKYVMQSDNDDFLNFQGINKIIYMLNKNNNNIGVGHTSHILKKKGLFRHINFEKKIDYCLNYPKLEIYENFFDNYVPLFYSIYSTKIFIKIYYNIVKSDIYFLSNFEYLFTLLAIKFGRIMKVNTNHYIRLINMSDSSNLKYKKIKIIEKDYKTDFYKMKNILFDGNIDMPKNFINQISINIFNRDKRIKKKSFFFTFILLCLKKIFHPYLNLKIMRYYLYFYSKLF
tara:strand:+ start:2945 stop:3871 length:927 start_codon:yes stop_codon:yes gene_type:complete